MYVLFDIGATNTRVGVSSDGTKVDKHKQQPTPKEFDAGMQMVKEMVAELAQGEEIRGAGGGVAGTFNTEGTKLVQSRLTDWVGRPVRDELFNIVQSPIRLMNDTACVGLGEAHFGAAKGPGVSVYVTVSTGIGGVKLCEGEVDESAMGFEPGHQIINVTEALTETEGHLENYASGTALSKKHGKIPSDIHDPEVWKQEAWFVAVGLFNTILHWSPHRLVLGGGVVLHTDLDLDLVIQNLTKLNSVYPHLPEIKKAELGDLGGLYGGLVLLHPPKRVV